MTGKIYVITQKQEDIILPENYTWIQSGAALHQHIDGILHDDDIADNRSEKNKYYSEYSAHYFIWKSNPEVDYIGIAHYRRFFDNTKLKIQPIDERRISRILKKHDIILPAHEHFELTHEEIFKTYHNVNDLNLLYDILHDMDESFYLFFRQWMQGKKISMRNVFIGKKETICEYWKWIFSVFDRLEGKISISEKDDYQGRVYGYLAERMLEAWMVYNQKKIFYGFLYNTQDKDNYFRRCKYYVKKVLGI